MPTIHHLATLLSRAFEGRTRDNGDKFRVLKDGSPEWMTAVCHAAHGNMMPDDWRYEFIEAAADLIAENSTDASTADELRELDSDIEADIYTADLTDWLSSHVERPGYVDEAVQEFGHSDMGIIGDIMLGQLAEKQEVFNLLLQELDTLANPDDEEDEEEDEESATI